MANDITILSCPQCGFPRIRDCGNGLYQCDDCGTHFDKDENIVLTEQEWLQTCNTEQLAERIISLCVTYFDRTDLSIVGAVKESLKINDHYDGHIQKDLLVEWLKQPHTIKE